VIAVDHQINLERVKDWNELNGNTQTCSGASSAHAQPHKQHEIHTGGASSGETLSVSFHIMSNSLLFQFIVLVFSIVELFTTLNHNLQKILTQL